MTIVKDSNGNKWIGAFDGGLSKFDGTTWTVYDTAIASSSLTIMDAAVDQSNNVWVTTQADGVLKFNGSNWTVYNTSNSGLADDYVWTVAIDLNGDKWFGTLLNGVVKFDNTNWTTYDMSNSQISATQIETIEVDKRGNKLIGTVWGGLDIFDGNSWTNFSTSFGLPDDDVHCIKFGLDSTKWMGTHAGLVGLDSSNTTLTIYNTTNSPLPNNDIHSVAIASDGTIWIGTELGGLVRYDGVNWTIYNSSNSGLPNDYINDILIDDDGSIWLSTRGGVAVLRFTTSVNIVSQPQTSFSVSPNPFSQSTTLKFDNAKNENHTLTLFDNLGQLIQTTTDIRTGRVEIEKQNLTNGLYYFQLRTGIQIIASGKLLIE